MAKVDAVLTRAQQYDLRDKDGTQFPTELLEYLNRAVFQLDTLLLNADSDLVKDYATTTFADGDTYVDLTSDTDFNNLIDIISIYYGTSEVKKKDWDFVRYKQINNSSSTGTPTYWCLQGTKLLFDIEAAADYTLTVNFIKRTGTLTSNDDMPYRGLFDDALRQAVILCAKLRNEENPNMDAALQSFFERGSMGIVFSRNDVQDYYQLDF